MFEIIYDYADESGYEYRNCSELFEGDWFELQSYIKLMRKQGCYNIEAIALEG